MNIFIVTSPTGGHFYPAIEITKKLSKTSEKIILILQKGSKLNEIILKELKPYKIKVEYINAVKFKRNNPLTILKFLITLPLLVSKILYLIYKHKPKILFSTGGYTAVPVIFSIKVFSPFTKIILQEQNAILSLTNKFLLPISTKICTGFYIKKNRKIIFTGNFIRENFKRELNKNEIAKKLKLYLEKDIILIFGGSQGSVAINTTFVYVIKEIYKNFPNIQIIHITGFSDYERISKEYKSLQIPKIIQPYSNNIEELYYISDFVICRAGAMTITELIYFKKPAILIPLPNAAELHQHKNAHLLKIYNCAEVVFQNEKFYENLKASIIKILGNKTYLENMSKNYDLLPKPTTSIEMLIKNYIKLKYAR
ncbi:MAG: UDP-N-acetylglucosamine--N-acetylmuramyl-(pentapeptide) pyrophosphoryl-undecaprenol N-acetylglucosamine transferase [Endomicrobia bacterium]|nr:UDP-N-acetylglucosamine--N-acetylmuramyl-(pentapeptide) pyrophosphoryl-undecaprenol N-acetylglucosamine transferase [Endomicrobiia bacterium]